MSECKVIRFPPQTPLQEAIELLQETDKEGLIDNLVLVYTTKLTEEEKTMFPGRLQSIHHYWFALNGGLMAKGLLDYMQDVIREWMRGER